jgi:hypothetical protein
LIFLSKNAEGKGMKNGLTELSYGAEHPKSKLILARRIHLKDNQNPKF